MCCIIEVVVEVLTILVYGITFYRYYSKRRLRKSMARRDTARSDLYLAQLRSQSAPNTPGYGGPLSPRSGGWIPPQGHTAYNQMRSNSLAKDAEGSSDSDEEGVQYATMPPARTFSSPKPFSLQPPPIRIHSATPRMSADGFSPVGTMAPSPPNSPPPAQEMFNEHAPVAEGETQYASVAIPGSYTTPLQSPGLPASHASGQGAGIGGFDFGLDGTLKR